MSPVSLFLIILTLPPLLGGCVDKSVSGYIPASSCSKKGFAKNREQALANRSKVIKVWGYVDGDNVFSKEWEDDSPEKCEVRPQFIMLHVRWAYDTGKLVDCSILL